MSSYTVIEGNLTKDPQGGQAKESGKPWARLDIAVSDRTRDEQGNWTDGPTSYYQVTAFGQRAEHARESFAKGDTVIAAGQLTVEAFTRQDGTSGEANRIVADVLGASVVYGKVTTSRTTK